MNLQAHSEALGYGTHLILDGFGAAAESLASDDAVRACLLEVGREAERGPEGAVALVHFWGPYEGPSGALLGAESYLVLHAFPRQRKLTLNAFSLHGLSSDASVKALKTHFGVGRTEHQRRGRSRQVPTSREVLERLLAGDRRYAGLRLTDLLRR